MNSLRILLFLLIVLGVVILAQSGKIQIGNKDKEKNVTKPTPSPYPVTAIPLTQPITPTQSLQYNKPSPFQTNEIELQYPNSTKISNTVFQTTDTPQQVTNWYKEKIINLGMRTTSVIQTSTNGTIKNKLVASDGKREIEIDIEKDKEDSTVRIEVSN